MTEKPSNKDEVLILPRGRRTLINKAPRLELVSVHAMTGDKMRIKLTAHAFGAVDSPTTTVHRINKEVGRHVGWKGMSTAFLPAGEELDIEFRQELHHSFLIIDEHYFKHFTDPNLEYRPQSFRHFAGLPSPIGSYLMRAIVDLVVHDEKALWPMMAGYIATIIAAHLINFFSADKRASRSNPAANLPRERLRRVIDFIEANIAQNIRLEDLAAAAALSTYHFVRQFHKAVGVTPVRFVWQRRVEHAKLRLRHRGVPLATIANDCGFSSQSHFATVFKRETGMTPTEFRGK